MDVKTAFLNGDLDHAIYMELPLGSADYGSKGVVWKLEKSLYSLKQASRSWYHTAKEEFGHLGFTCCDADHSVFIQNGWGQKFCIIALYVDDLMVLLNDINLLDQKKDKLKDTFKMKDLGPIHWFLGLEITWDWMRHSISISQSRYVSDIVECFGFTNSCPVSTPITTSFRLPSLHAPEINTHH